MEAEGDWGKKQRDREFSLLTLFQTILVSFELIGFWVWKCQTVNQLERFSHFTRWKFLKNNVTSRVFIVGQYLLSKTRNLWLPQFAFKFLGIKLCRAISCKRSRRWNIPRLPCHNHFFLGERLEECLKDVFRCNRCRFFSCEVKYSEIYQIFLPGINKVLTHINAGSARPNFSKYRHLFLFWTWAIILLNKARELRKLPLGGVSKINWTNVL